MALRLLIGVLLVAAAFSNAAPLASGQPAETTDLRLLTQPRRLVDTQPGSGYQGAGAPLTGLAEPHCYQVAGQVGVPEGAAGVVANVTAVGFTVDGWITLFPAGAVIPDTSTLNFDTDQYAVANMAMVPLGQGGLVCAVGHAGTHLIVDIIGYLQAAGTTSGLTCPAATTLAALVTCIVDQSGMPDRTGVYVIPNDLERAQFGVAAGAMLRGTCTDAVLGGTLTGTYHVARFTDASTSRPYCVMLEVGDADDNGRVDKGWGTFIVDPSATRELNIAIAHPLDDARTQVQGAAVFELTRSRSFLLAGARRDLGGQRTCPGEADPCPASDVAHNEDTMFQVVTQELADFYGATDWTQLQFHGNRSCPATDIHMSYGARLPLTGTDKASILKNRVKHHNQDWTITLFGENSQPCGLNGTTNVQGRLLNANPPNANRRFIHIEQYMDDQRTDRREARNWVPAILDAWP